MKYTIGDKEFTLTYNMSTWLAIEETAGKRMHELVQDLDGPNRIRAMMILFIALAHDPELTDTWIDEHVEPTWAAFNDIVAACNKAIAQGMHVEKGEDEPTDVTLAELEKKTETTSPGGK